jgi:hypothetical protein
MGNIEPLKRLATAFKNEMTKGPQDIPGYTSNDQVRQEQEENEAGQQYINNTIIPAGIDIATRYGADPKEVMGAIEWFIRREPPQFLTKEKLEQIVQYDVPQAFEAQGYNANGKGSPVHPQPSGDVEELKKTVAALQSRIAETNNAKVENLRTKSKKSPPAGGGATPGAGDSMPAFKSRSQMKAWMQGDDEWQKA